MKIVTLAAISSMEDLLSMAEEDVVVIKTPEGREFILQEIDDSDDAEIEAIRRNRELMEFLDQRFQQPATLTLEEVKKKHGLT